MEKLLWLDLEMTGLDVKKEVIIEIGAIVTDIQLNNIANFHTIVQQPQKYIDAMDEWNTKQHNKSGLVQLIPHGKPPEQAEQELIAFTKEHFPGNDPVILAGNSIGQDRLFIAKYFQDFDLLLHYRMLDVSSFKIVFNKMYNYVHHKQNGSHRALDDIQESIDELKNYLGHIKF